MLLAATGELGPYVLVAHSYGGLVALLYARLRPEEVGGLVMVDAVSDLIRREASAEELAGWDASNRVFHPAAPEAVELLDAIGKIEAAPSLPKRPAVVLSADKPWPSPETQGGTSRGVTTLPSGWRPRIRWRRPFMPRISPPRIAGTISTSISRGWSSTPFAKW
jgi:pimeloyl-ACP methyl ester carboxylesterase